MTRLNAAESALFLTQMARQELRGKIELRFQLADLRLAAAEKALRGSLDMEQYEAKILGKVREVRGDG